MEIKVLRKLLTNSVLLDKKIKFYEKRGVIRKVPFDMDEIKGHLAKSNFLK